MEQTNTKSTKTRILFTLLFILLIMFFFSTNVKADSSPSFTSTSLEEEEGVLGYLSLYSYDNFESLGHAWMTFYNSSSTRIKIGKRDVLPKNEMAFGTWKNSFHNGIFYNIESSRYHYEDYYEGRVSLTIKITSEDQIKTINDYISANDYWKYFKNCSYFASNLWNKLSSDKVYAGKIPKPSTLIKSMKQYDYYEINREIKEPIEPVIYTYKNNIEYSSPQSTASHDGVVNRPVAIIFIILLIAAFTTLFYLKKIKLVFRILYFITLPVYAYFTYFFIIYTKFGFMHSINSTKFIVVNDISMIAFLISQFIIVLLLTLGIIYNKFILPKKQPKLV